MMGTTALLNTRSRPHLLIGVVLSVWLYLFLVLIGPFDAAELSMGIRTIIMTGYGLVFFLSYAMLIPIQKKLYEHKGRWKIGSELAMIALFCLFCLPLSFAYYKTDIVNGDFSFAFFLSAIYLPTLAIITPVVFVGRYLVARNENETSNKDVQINTLTLLGENKLDILKLPFSDLIALEAANNYVTVYYLLDGELKKKLLRSSLRKMQKAVPEMTQVHRSYLVNSSHFVEWQDGLTLVLTQLTVPVSQKHKAKLMAMTAFVPK